MPHGTALITGAAGGIGSALAHELSATHEELILVDTDGDSLSSLGAALPCPTRLAVLDVTHPRYRHDLTDLVQSVPSLDGLFTFAGVMHTGTVQRSTLDDLVRVIEINLVGTIATVHACLPYLAAGASVVTASSAIEGIAFPRHATYVASKAGVYGFTRTLANELEHENANIRVSTALIGGVHTDILRNGSFAADEDPAVRAASFDRRVARSSAEQIAHTIVRGQQRGARVIHAGPDSHIASLLARTLGRYTRLPRM
ncbi:short-subunit dehydrogenase [Branchiibius hedensis]|uniref:Short-chain dehydrogenase n=1 Tax=Branchiibius hedensis TaxID=672460 RepID=A0A2Y9CAX1_9MICO|nr:SDR family oxidoreductase [Branchiibius hedensis]PWJ23357.1 short-subunit dehydrogenase [Branchiibius hedensis]SSA59046.1 Short-chain dehydrogenase [Branchiibius hedensis]